MAAHGTKYAAFLHARSQQIRNRSNDIHNLRDVLQQRNFYCEDEILIHGLHELKSNLKRLAREVGDGGILIVFISAEGVSTNGDHICIRGDGSVFRLEDVIKPIFKGMVNTEKVFIVQADRPPTQADSDGQGKHKPAEADFSIFWNDIQGSTGIDNLCEVLQEMNDNNEKLTMDKIITRARDKIDDRSAIVFLARTTATHTHEI